MPKYGAIWYVFSTNGKLETDRFVKPTKGSHQMRKSAKIVTMSLVRVPSPPCIIAVRWLEDSNPVSLMTAKLPSDKKLSN